MSRSRWYIRHVSGTTQKACPEPREEQSAKLARRCRQPRPRSAASAGRRRLKQKSVRPARQMPRPPGSDETKSGRPSPWPAPPEPGSMCWQPSVERNSPVEVAASATFGGARRQRSPPRTPDRTTSLADSVPPHCFHVMPWSWLTSPPLAVSAVIAPPVLPADRCSDDIRWPATCVHAAHPLSGTVPARRPRQQHPARQRHQRHHRRCRRPASSAPSSAAPHRAIRTTRDIRPRKGVSHRREPSPSAPVRRPPDRPRAPTAPRNSPSGKPRPSRLRRRCSNKAPAPNRSAS